MSKAVSTNLFELQELFKNSKNGQYIIISENSDDMPPYLFCELSFSEMIIKAYENQIAFKEGKQIVKLRGITRTTYEPLYSDCVALTVWCRDNLQDSEHRFTIIIQGLKCPI